MNTHNCERESQVMAAVRAGQWGADLRAHLAHCENCAEAALLAEFLLFDLQTGGDPELPSAGQVWRKAQIRARRADAERALRPVRVVQKISALCVLLASLLPILHYGPQLQHRLNDLPALVLNTEESLTGVFFLTAIAFVVSVSAGLTYLLHSSK